MTIIAAEQAKAIIEKAFLNFGISLEEHDAMIAFIDSVTVPFVSDRYTDDWMHKLGEEIRAGAVH